jgi:hypothetical protein
MEPARCGHLSYRILASSHLASVSLFSQASAFATAGRYLFNFLKTTCKSNWRRKAWRRGAIADEAIDAYSFQNVKMAERWQRQMKSGKIRTSPSKLRVACSSQAGRAFIVVID